MTSNGWPMPHTVRFTALEKRVLTPVLRSFFKSGVAWHGVRTRGYANGWAHCLKAPTWVVRVAWCACRSDPPGAFDQGPHGELSNLLPRLLPPKRHQSLGVEAIESAFLLGGDEALIAIAAQSPDGAGSLGFTLSFGRGREGHGGHPSSCPSPSRAAHGPALPAAGPCPRPQ